MAVGTTAFPTSLDTAVELVEITNNASSTLSGNVLIGDTTIGVVDIGEFPTTGYGTIVDDLTTPTKVEIISWTGKSGSNLTGCTRGTQGTSAAAFSSGNYIEVRPTAGHHEALRGAVIAIETKLGTGSTIAVNKLEALTASRLMVTDASGFASAASVTATEAGYLSGVTSAIQTQLGTKAGSGAVTGSGLTMATARLLGRTTASSGAIEEISIGSGLSMSAGTLTATGGGGSGDVVGPGSATDNAVSRFDGTTGKSVKNSVVTIADTTGNMAGVGTLNTHTIPVGTDTFVLLTANQTLTTKTLTSPDINGGTADSLTSLSVRSTGAAFDLLFANTEVLTGNKTLTVKVNDTSRTVDLGGNLTLAAAFSTSGANALTLTTTGATNVTLPTTGTLVNSAVSSLSSLTTVGTITSGGLGTGAVLGGVTMTLGSDADGDIYYRSSNVLTRLAKGAALQQLRMNAGATAPEWATIAGGGGLTIGTTAITSGTAGRILYETSGNVVGEIAGSSVDANGAVQFAATARSSGVAQYFRINTPADTGQTAATESVGAYFGGNGSGSTVTRTWAAGTVTTQRENVFVAPTYATGNFTTAATVAITASPIASGGTITNPYSLWVQSGTVLIDTASGADTLIALRLQRPDVPTRYISFTPSSGGAYGEIKVGLTTMLLNPNNGAANGIVSTNTASLGVNKISSLGATLHVVSQAAGTVALRADSAATPSTDIFQATVNGGAGTGFVVSSTGAPSSPGAGANSERYGSGSTAAGASSIAIGNGATAGGSSSVIIGTSATNNNVGSTIGIGASIGASSSSSQIAIGGSIAASNNPSIVIGFGSSTGAGNGSNIFIGHTVGSSSGAGVTNNIAIGSAINYLSAQAGLLVFGYTISNANLPSANAAIFGSSTVPYNDVFFGKGYINATPTAYTINGTGGSGTNIAGAALNLAGGKGTGTGTGGDVNIQFARAGSTGSSLNTLSTIMAFSATATGTTETMTGPNGGTNVIGVLMESVTLSTSGTTTDSTIDLPANSIILSVTGRITTTITTATDWKLGDATIADRFSDANATLTSGTTTVGINQWKADRTTSGQGAFQQSTAKVRITTTGTPGAGVIRITIHYITLSAPTS